jgi:hypothetical protein
MIAQTPPPPKKYLRTAHAFGYPALPIDSSKMRDTLSIDFLAVEIVIFDRFNRQLDVFRIRHYIMFFPDLFRSIAQ